MSVESSPDLAFEALRQRLFGIGYRMLGSVADAEDLVQETYLRWHESDRGRVENVEAWLVSVITRLAIDRLRRNAAERARYVGDWLPEPLPTGEQLGADRSLEQRGELSMAFLLMLERLSSVERAVLVLREVFDYDYAVIAEAVGKSEAATRQTLHRARERMQTEPRAARATKSSTQALLGRLLGAITAGDQNGLLELLSPDVQLISDGGGKVRAARRPILGADRVSRFLLGIQRKYRLSYRELELNGAPAWVTYLDGRAFACTVVEASEQRILALYRVLNPDKIKRIP